jgi:hypothetical protein
MAMPDPQKQGGKSKLKLGLINKEIEDLMAPGKNEKRGSNNPFWSVV